MINSRNTLPFLLAILCCSGTTLAAPGDQAEKPTAPFIETGNAPVTITRVFEYPTKSPDASKPDFAPLPPGIGQAQITKTVTEINGPVKRVLTYRGTSTSPSEFWVADGTLIGPHPRDPAEVVVAGAAMDENIGDLRQRFPDASWAAEINFVKWEAADGEKCRVHTTNLPPATSSIAINPVSGVVTAWISENSRRPVKIKAADKTIHFTYAAGPAQPVALPQKYAEFLAMLKLGATGRAR